MHDLLNNQLSLLAGCDHVIYMLMWPQCEEFLLRWGLFDQNESKESYTLPLALFTPLFAGRVPASTAIWTTRVYYLCCPQSWVLVWRGERFLNIVYNLAMMNGAFRCLLWSQRSWRIGGLKGAEIHSSMCSASESCLKAFFSAPSDVLEKHCNKPGYPHMTGSRITAQCQVKGSVIIKAQGVLWCQMWLI